MPREDPEEKMERFSLLAKDFTSPPTIIHWIELNINNQQCSDEKLTEAFVLALRMRNHPKRKMPD